MPVPVLCYHRIGGPLELGITRVGQRVFEKQMRALAQAGWRTLTLAEFTNTLSRSSALRTPHSALLLTLDDAYASLADFAYPLLAELGFTATTFLITDFVGRTNTWDARYTWRRLTHLDWPAVEQWRARGFDFGSHGATHRRLTWLTASAAADDLERSRDTLVRRLGEDAGTAVAFPFGATNDRLARSARLAGYTLGFGGVRGDPHDRFDLPRVPVYSWDAFRVPLGLRSDGLGILGRWVAHIANRCAVGTSLLKAVSGES